MNKRIDELFAQALDAAVPETWSKLDMTQLHRLKEKFAQLIIKECIDQIEHDYKYVRDTDTKWKTAFNIACDLQEHFGDDE